MRDSTGFGETNPASLAASRRFQKGSWDLRRDERRKVHAPIYFPDRRQAERRAFAFQEIEIKPSPDFSARDR